MFLYRATVMQFGGTHGASNMFLYGNWFVCCLLSFQPNWMMLTYVSNRALQYSLLSLHESKLHSGAGQLRTISGVR